ncbi:hypothetical protein PIB30_091648 [Stylosanthes scabra]|uniref:Uncharacterized protein n=1 Tax=Stylosanthes scabra TaxID=79078 RepID=A0ABU6RVB4_9FABA|nr:hypothetical protein [Stylosanthes scabra]
MTGTEAPPPCPHWIQKVITILKDPIAFTSSNDITGGVRSESGRRERKERKDRNKSRRPLLEPMRTHHKEPCVRIQAWAACPIVDLGTYAYAYEASMRTRRSFPASINRGAFHRFKGSPLPHLA